MMSDTPAPSDRVITGRDHRQTIPSTQGGGVLVDKDGREVPAQSRSGMSDDERELLKILALDLLDRSRNGYQQASTAKLLERIWP